MLISYLAALVLLSFAFRVVLIVIAVPLFFLSSLISRQGYYRVHLWYLVFNQVVIAYLYTGYIAVITLLFTSKETVTASWPYFLIGMVWVFLTLGSNAESKCQTADEEEEAAATGAAVGVIVGLIGFPLFYKLPSLALMIPGADWFMGWSYNVGLWLSQFSIVRFILLIIVSGYVINSGFVAIVGSIVLLGFLWSRLFRRSKELCHNG